MNRFYNSHKREIFLFLLMLFLELATILVLSQKNGLALFFRSDANDFRIIVKNMFYNGVFSLETSAPFLPTNFRTPGYPLFLLLIYLIFSSLKPAIFIGAAVFAFSAPLVYLIAKEIFREKIAFTGAVLFAIEPWAVFQSGFLVADQIFMPAFLLTVYLFCRYLKFFKKYYLYYASFLLGVSVLIRPIVLFFISIFIFLTFISESKTSVKSAFKYSALSLLIFGLVLSPWLIRNKILLNTWQISTISNVSLYIENYSMLQQYLGKWKSDNDANESARILLGANNYFEARKPANAQILSKAAFEGIRTNLGSYIAMHLVRIPSFLIKNSYGNIFLDLKVGNADVQSKIMGFLSKRDFFGLVGFVKNVSFMSKILMLISFFWPVIIFLAIFGLIEGFKKFYKSLFFWFLIFWILYFFGLTGNLRDVSRYKLAINAPLFILAAVGFYKIKNSFLTLIRKND